MFYAMKKEVMKMRYLTDKQYKNRLKKIQLKNQQKEKRKKLHEEKNKFKHKLKLPATSKLLLIGAVLLCLEIVIFCEYVMLKLQDSSSMYVLIGIPASLIPIILGYFYKSKAENTSGGIVFETAMSQMTETANEEEIAENDGSVG